MLSHRFYYQLKPFVPWRLRMALRRLTARRKRTRCETTWPIDESTKQPPPGWPGWPEGRKFAFVLTHDVEDRTGLDKCRQLAEMEQQLGFCSSFNFIPEGPYAVPPDLRSWLTGQGFEVGVHDLNHDGKLFTSRRGFLQKAKKINHYLREWQAGGYRSGFMLRNLDWLHDLEIAYDASTFDTDPFEPQPDGAGTIFPFWIPLPGDWPRQTSDGRQPPTEPPSRSGYVELPYTLPQDSTVFLLLQEKTPDLWLRKLDWLAAHGGMALVNVHPDYINFGPGPERRREYPSAAYAGLLRHVNEKYAGQFWNPLPRDLASWFKRNCPPNKSPSRPPLPVAAPPRSAALPRPGLRARRAAVLLYSRYPADPRPRRAAEAMIEAGMQVDLLCLADSGRSPPAENVGGVQVTRVSLQHRRDRKWLYLWQYGRFFASSFWFLLTKGLRRRYDVVHVHNMPDFLVFATLVPKLRGARIILDLHDPMPELMESIYGLRPGDWKVGFLRRLERWSIGFADLALTPNITFRNLFLSRSCRPEKMQIVMNSPQQEIFDPEHVTAGPAAGAGGFRIMHHGSIVHRHGIDLLVEAVARLRPEIPGIRLDIYGAATPFLDTVLALAGRLGIGDIVCYHGAKTQQEIAAAILECTVGVVPNRRSAFIEINFPTRLFEYLAMRRPVIAPSTQGIRDYFNPEQMIFFQPDNVADLMDRLRWVQAHPEAAGQIMQRGLQVYRENLWQREKDRFLDHVNQLVTRA